MSDPSWARDQRNTKDLIRGLRADFPIVNLRLSVAERLEGLEADLSAEIQRREEAEAELKGLIAILADPNAVHLNMLRGTIARPSLDQIAHIYQTNFRPVPISTTEGVV